MAGDEPGACRVFADIADDVFAVPVACVPQERLISVVVVLVSIFKEPVVTPDGPAG